MKLINSDFNGVLIRLTMIKFYRNIRSFAILATRHALNVKQTAQAGKDVLDESAMFYQTRLLIDVP